MWWPPGTPLKRRNRVSVMRSVARGDRAVDSRLASAVARVAAHVIAQTIGLDDNSHRERYRRWFVYALIAAWAGWMVFVILDGRMTSAAVLLAALLIWVVLGPRLRRLTAEIRANAERAEAVARAALPANQMDDQPS